MKSNQDVFISGHAASVIRDKFLVMSTGLQDEKSPSELAALWKTIPKANIVEHRSVKPALTAEFNFSYLSLAFCTLTLKYLFFFLWLTDVFSSFFGLDSWLKH